MSGTLSPPVPRPASLSPGGTRPLSPLRSIARQSHTSVQSWISHLASTTPPPMSSTPKPITLAMPTPFGPSDSPNSIEKSMSGSDHGHQPPMGLNEKGYESVLKLPVPEWPNSGEKGSDAPGEIPNIPTEVDSPASPGSRKSKARSFVGGFVTSIRSIPRAVTHSSVYDRRTSSGKYSSQTDSQVLDGSASGGVVHPQLWYRGPPPPPLATLEHRQHRHHAHGPMQYPILLAHPPPPGIPHYEPPLSTIGSEYYSKQGSSSSAGGSISSRLGEFLGELNSLPWISPGRVAIDYMPGETQRARSTRSGSNGSWYSINPPATPSDISNRWKYVPEPWFPPTQLPPTQEVDEHEEGHRQGDTEKKLRNVQEELQEKIRELDAMRQVVEHQKMHIGALETEIAELREAQSQSEVRRWRSSSRKSLSGYRKRDSVRTVTSLRKTMSVSRPPSSFYED